MIIAFYPGAGGNRYLRMLENLDWKQPHTSYDLVVQNQHVENRYLINPITINNNFLLTHCMNLEMINKFFSTRPKTFILGDLKKCLRREWKLAGHNRYKKLNFEKKIDRIQHYAVYKDKNWPTVTTLQELDLLPADILAETNLNFQKVVDSNTQTVNTLQSVIDEFSCQAESAYETIKWHTDYYKKYPVELTNNCKNVINIENDDSEFAEVMRHELDLYSSEIFDEIWNVVNA